MRKHSIGIAWNKVSTQSYRTNHQLSEGAGAHRKILLQLSSLCLIDNLQEETLLTQISCCHNTNNKF